jgi:hypothetical protein
LESKIKSVWRAASIDFPFFSGDSHLVCGASWSRSKHLYSYIPREFRYLGLSFSGKSRALASASSAVMDYAGE